MIYLILDSWVYSVLCAFLAFLFAYTCSQLTSLYVRKSSSFLFYESLVRENNLLNFYKRLAQRTNGGVRGNPDSIPNLNALIIVLMLVLTFGSRLIDNLLLSIGNRINAINPVQDGAKPLTQLVLPGGNGILNLNYSSVAAILKNYVDDGPDAVTGLSICDTGAIAATKWPHLTSSQLPSDPPKNIDYGNSAQITTDTNIFPLTCYSLATGDWNACSSIYLMKFNGNGIPTSENSQQVSSIWLPGQVFSTKDSAYYSRVTYANQNKETRLELVFNSVDSIKSIPAPNSNLNGVRLLKKTTSSGLTLFSVIYITAVSDSSVTYSISLSGLAKTGDGSFVQQAGKLINNFASAEWGNFVPGANQGTFTWNDQGTQSCSIANSDWFEIKITSFTKTLAIQPFNNDPWFLYSVPFSQNQCDTSKDQYTAAYVADFVKTSGNSRDVINLQIWFFVVAAIILILGSLSSFIEPINTFQMFTTASHVGVAPESNPLVALFWKSNLIMEVDAQTQAKNLRLALYEGEKVIPLSGHSTTVLKTFDSLGNARKELLSSLAYKQA